MRTDEIRAKEQAATQNPIRYYVGGEPYVKIGNVELRNHPAVEKLAEYDRMEKYILPKLRSEISRLTADNYELRDNITKMTLDANELNAELAGYREAEQDGRLVVLPCKIGEKIYMADGHMGKVFQRLASIEDMLTKIKPMWGKVYFATPEEAEAALAGKK